MFVLCYVLGNNCLPNYNSLQKSCDTCKMEILKIKKNCNDSKIIQIEYLIKTSAKTTCKIVKRWIYFRLLFIHYHFFSFLIITSLIWPLLLCVLYHLSLTVTIHTQIAVISVNKWLSHHVFGPSLIIFFLCLLLKAQNALTGHCGKEQMNRTEIETEARCETAILK